jgi:hypothetical protein
MTKIVNIDSLNRAAQTYEPILQTLPFDTLEAGLGSLGVNVIDVKDKNILVFF